MSGKILGRRLKTRYSSSMNQVLRKALLIPLCFLTAVMVVPDQDPSAFSEVSSEELLDYAEQRVGIRAEQDNLYSATVALERRMKSGQSDYLSNNQRRFNRVIAGQTLYNQRWKMENELYSYQQDPAQLVIDINASHYSRAELNSLPKPNDLIDAAQRNIDTALHLLALFGAYELSMGQFDEAVEILELYTDLPDGIHPGALERYRGLLASLHPELTKFRLASRRLPIPEIFFATLSFGISTASLADLIIPGFTLPFYPGDSSQRNAALTSTVISGSLIGASALFLPPKLIQPPMHALSEYLSATWGHLIEGSIQIFEDFRHEPRQLILLTLAPDRYVVFSESVPPHLIPGVFDVARTGDMQIQITHGLQRITTPRLEVHDGINLVPMLD